MQSNAFPWWSPLPMVNTKGWSGDHHRHNGCEFIRVALTELIVMRHCPDHLTWILTDSHPEDRCRNNSSVNLILIYISKAQNANPCKSSLHSWRRWYLIPPMIFITIKPIILTLAPSCLIGMWYVRIGPRPRIPNDLCTLSTEPPVSLSLAVPLSPKLQDSPQTAQL